LGRCRCARYGDEQREGEDTGKNAHRFVCTSLRSDAPSAFSMAPHRS
jgi:hypothetical protein